MTGVGSEQWMNKSRLSKRITKRACSKGAQSYRSQMSVQDLEECKRRD